MSDIAPRTAGVAASPLVGVAAAVPPARPGPDPEEQRSSLADYVWIVYKRLWTLPVMMALCVMGALIQAGMKPRVYSATARIRISSNLRVAESVGVGHFLDNLDPGFATEIELIRGRPVAARAVDKLKLAYRDGGQAAAPADAAPARPPSPAAREVEQRREELIERILGGLSVTRVGASSLVDITFTDQDPEMAKDIANAVASTAEEMETERVNRAAIAFMDYLKKQQTIFHENLVQNEKRIQALENELNIISLRDDASVKALDLLASRLASLGEELVAASTERVKLGVRRRQMEQMLKDGQSVEFLPEVIDSKVMQGLLEQKNSVERSLAGLSRVAGPKNPDLLDMQAKLAALNQDIAREAQRAFDALKARHEAVQAREALLQEELAKLKVEVARVNDRNRERESLRREAQMNAQWYNLFLMKAKETGIAGDIQGSRIEVVQRALTPSQPSLSGRYRAIRAGLALGLGLGVALALALDYMDRRVKGVDDIERLLGTPVLAAVNRFPGKIGKDGAAKVVVAQAPKSAVAETFRTLRMRLSVSGRMDRVVLVTSAGPSEGKTTISSNLAAAMAETGKRVLLIDADIRKPSVSKGFGLPAGKGDLVACLQGGVTLAQAAQPSGLPNLSILPTAEPVTAARVSQVMDAGRWRALLDEALSRYDIVVVDSSPVGAVSEPLLLATLARSVLLVVRAGHAARGMVQRALEHLREAGADVVGSVVNFADMDRRGGYGYYYYRRHYGYHSGYGYGYGYGAGSDKMSAEG